MNVQRYNKFITAVAIPIIMFVLESAGLPIPEGFATELTAVLTAVGVWLIPNKA